MGLNDNSRFRKTYSFFRVPPVPPPKEVDAYFFITQWYDNLVGAMMTTSSVAIGGAANTFASSYGTDNVFVVSGTIGSVATPKRALFTGDVVISGSLNVLGGISGSSGGSGGSSNGWIDGTGKMKTTGSISIDTSSNYANQIGTDVFFYVSGTSGLSQGSGKRSVFGGDIVASASIYITGTLYTGTASFGGTPLTLPSVGNIRGDKNFTVALKQQFGSDAYAFYSDGYNFFYGDPFGNNGTTYFTAGTQNWIRAPLNIFQASTIGGHNYHYADNHVYCEYAGNNIALILSPPGLITTGSAALLQFGSLMTGTLGQLPASVGKGADLTIAAQRGAPSSDTTGRIILSGSQIVMSGSSPMVSFASGSFGGSTLGLFTASAGNMRVPAGFTWVRRNSANTTDHYIFQDDGNGNYTFGDGLETTMVINSSLTVRLRSISGLAEIWGGGAGTLAAGTGIYMWGDQVAFQDHSLTYTGLFINSPTSATGSASLIFAQTTTGSISQLPSGFGPGTTLTITAQQAGTGGSNGGNLLLNAGSGLTSGSTGNLILSSSLLSITASAGAGFLVSGSTLMEMRPNGGINGTECVQFYQGGQPIAQINGLGASQYGSIYFGSNATPGAINNNNYQLAGTPTSTRFNAPGGGSVSVRVGDVEQANFNTTGLSLVPALLTFTAATVAPTFTQAAASSGTGATLTIQAQQGSGSNVGGDLILSGGLGSGQWLSPPGKVAVLGAVRYTNRTLTGSYTIDSIGADQTLFLSGSPSGPTSNLVITLPTATQGRRLLFKDIVGNLNNAGAAGVSTWALTGSGGSKFIEALTGSYTLNAPWQKLTLEADNNNNWWIVGQ